VCDRQSPAASIARVEHAAGSEPPGAGPARSIKRWAPVVTATLLVAGCPAAVVWWLRASGTITLAILGAAVGMGLSLLVSQLGCLIWERRPRSGDLLFSELMIWGFLHRLHTQHQLRSALEMVGPMGAEQPIMSDRLSTKELATLLERLVSSIEARDPYLHGHSQRVARQSWMIARRMGVPRTEAARIRAAAAIHDVGKIKTPKAILHKAGPLSEAEYETIKKHASDGAAMATALRDPDLTAMVCRHHERLDGSGYPGALSAEEIPLGARIIAVADTFDAITSTRPYRAASSHKKAIAIIRQEAGTKLDPGVVRAFCSNYAGRRPLVLWASMADLPERVLSWLGGNGAGIASAAKVSAIAALVGGVAAITPTLATPSRSRQGRHAAPSSTVLAQASIYRATHAGARVIAHSSPRGPRRGQAKMRGPLTAVDVTAAPQTSDSAARPGSAAVTSQPPRTGGSGAGREEHDGEPRSPTTPEERSSDTPGEEIKKGEAEQGAGGEGAASEVGRVAEAVNEVHGKAEEALGKSDEGAGKATEALVTPVEGAGRTTEAVVKTGGGAGTTTEAVLGKAAEGLGKAHG
jgi:putative nucleotidyltransferase with HDIG domain